MEATLSLEKKRHERSTDIDIERCLICQCKRSPFSSSNVSELRDAKPSGVERVLTAASERQK